MNNYSILQKNILLGLESEEGQASFLWACDRPNADRYQYKAEEFAHEVEQILEFNGPIIDISVGLFENQKIALKNKDVKQDLLDFIASRHCASVFKGKKKWKIPNGLNNKL